MHSKLLDLDRTMGDKGLSSKARDFVTPYKKDVVLAFYRQIRGPTPAMQRIRRRQALKNFCKFNRDIGHHR